MDRAALPVGTRFGEIEIVRTLAVGGFGIVYLGHDHALGREVAIKEFMPAHLVGRRDGLQVGMQSRGDPAEFAQGLQAFMSEARLLASLSHASVVKVYRLWEANGTGYIAMPYLRGPTLGDIRRSMSEPPTERWLRSVVEPLLDALATMHAAGVCHRDIAPDNIVMTASGVPVLLDFGAARRLDASRVESVTAVLKPCYAPIEQYADETQMRQGPWTDLYALGALLVFLIDAKPPPDAPSRCVHDSTLPLARRRIPGISKRFLSAVDWALKVRPQDRPQSVAAFQAVLRGARETARVPAAQATPIAPPRRLPTSAWPAWLQTALGSAVVAIVFSAWQGRAPEPRPASAPIAAATATAAPAGAKPEPKPDPPRVVLAPSASDAVLPTLLASAPTPQAATAVEPARSAQRAASRASRKRAATATPRVAALGPTEICAARNFFLRPYCVQRQCDLPRFAARPECTQLRAVARYGRDGPR